MTPAEPAALAWPLPALAPEAHHGLDWEEAARLGPVNKLPPARLPPAVLAPPARVALPAWPVPVVHQALW